MHTDEVSDTVFDPVSDTVSDPVPDPGSDPVPDPGSDPLSGLPPDSVSTVQELPGRARPYSARTAASTVFANAS
jgi:hypothetical protein